MRLKGQNRVNHQPRTVYKHDCLWLIGLGGGEIFIPLPIYLFGFSQRHRNGQEIRFIQQESEPYGTEETGIGWPA
jgi:hypothetical protein